MVVANVSAKYADALTDKFAPNGTRITVTAGRKFDKLVVESDNSTQRSVHGFVERETGLLFKAATWAAPAKGFRYNLSTEEEFAAVVAKADKYGSYLYR